MCTYNSLVFSTETLELIHIADYQKSEYDQEIP